MTYYVEIKIPHPPLGYTYEKCVPLYKTRTTDDGEIETLVFLISGQNLERKIWIRREQIC